MPVSATILRIQNKAEKYLCIACLILLQASCKKKEVFVTESVAEYMPLQIGKSITYRLDSTVFVRSGSAQEVRKYQVRHTIAAETTDNTGRKTFVVHRQINNEKASGPWINNGSYLITAFDYKIEVVTDNLRVTAIQGPLREGFTWKGNSYLPANPYNSLYDYNLIGNDMNTWNFEYKSFGDTTYEGQQFKDVWTVEQNNVTLNIPPESENSIGTKEVSVEQYAKGIGLVFKTLQLYEYQSGSSEYPEPNYTGFGITMWMIAHN